MDDISFRFRWFLQLQEEDVLTTRPADHDDPAKMPSAFELYVKENTSCMRKW